MTGLAAHRRGGSLVRRRRGSARSRRRLRERGVGHGDIVVLTARDEPRYLLSLLAITTIGARGIDGNTSARSCSVVKTIVLTNQFQHESIPRRCEGHVITCRPQYSSYHHHAQ